MTKDLLRLGWYMSCAGLCFHILAAVYFGDLKSWPAIIYFLACAVASSMLKSAYEHSKVVQ